MNQEEQLGEAARVQVVKLRIRNGQVQRRKKVSNIPGMILRGGKLKKMSVIERRNRKMGAKIGKIKRRAKLQQAIRKRAKSLQKRKRLGY